jgi:hypothetical protein
MVFISRHKKAAALLRRSFLPLNLASAAETAHPGARTTSKPVHSETLRASKVAPPHIEPPVAMKTASAKARGCPASMGTWTIEATRPPCSTHVPVAISISPP